MSDPKVSIVVLNYNHPEVIDICLHTLAITEGVEYEVVVVDNGSPDPQVLPALRKYKEEGLITTLVENPVNSFFSEGNNIGVRNTNPNSEYVLLLNSDVAFLRGDWLTKLLQWMDGTAEYKPTVWGLQPTEPKPGPRDIISAGWSHDGNLEGKVRPEGWCCLIRRTVWRDLNPEFPWHYGIEEALANSVRDGARCGVLFNYAPYMVHREGGSGKIPDGDFINAHAPDLPGWFKDIEIETLDFTLGPEEHSSYLEW